MIWSTSFMEAHFGELGGLDLDERRLREEGHPTGNFCFPQPVGPTIRIFFGMTCANIRQGRE